MERLRDGLLLQERVRAIQEELVGFLDAEVLDPKGEYYREVVVQAGP